MRRGGKVFETIVRKKRTQHVCKNPRDYLLHGEDQSINDLVVDGKLASLLKYQKRVEKRKKAWRFPFMPSRGNLVIML